MDIAYQSKALRDLCEDNGLALVKYGRGVSSALLDRLADIDAAECVGDLIAGQPASLTLGKKEVLRIALIDGLALYLEANQNKVPTNQQGKVKWPDIRRLRLLKIDHDEI